MAKSDYDETKAVAHLPNLDVEIFHCRWRGEEELLSITLRAVPSFETFFQPRILCSYGCERLRRRGRRGSTWVRQGQIGGAA